MARSHAIVAATAAWALAAIGVSAQFPLDSARGMRMTPSQMRSHPAIAYDAPTDDPVARLNARVKAGDVRFDAEPTRGYLRSVLRALNVPVSSQILVFSKTSFQAPRITPANPRAIYFNDTVTVGWVRGGDVLEFTAQDPRQGTIFYTLDQKAAAPEFKRNNVSCIACHTSEATQNVPGLFIGSVYPETDGTTAYGPAYTTDHRSPFDLRWGGWYVTGTHRGTRHMGNATVTDKSDLRSMVTPASVHVESLAGRFDPDGYLSTTSDIVALLVIEHQARMLNLITRVGWEARLGADAGRPLDQAVNELVDYMLFVDEAPLPGPIRGTTDFAETFARPGPRDRKGRSLRDLDLGTRLLKYRCSYLIYSEPFDALPSAARSLVYQRLYAVLSGTDRDPVYQRLGSDERQAILDILRETKPGLPAYFFPSVSGE